MPLYRIHRLKESLRPHFRQSPHTSGPSTVKMKDYELAGVAEQSNPYALWQHQKELGGPLQVGDVLEEGEGGPLLLYKFIGFEPAVWFVPEPKPAAAPPPAEASLEAVEEKR